MSLDLPEFSSALRGYDRGQVDTFVAELRRHVADAHDRALRAERALEEIRRRPRSDMPGAPGGPDFYRLQGEALRVAGEEAEELRAAARAEAESIIRRAHIDADQLAGVSRNGWSLDDVDTMQDIPLQDLSLLREQAVTAAEDLMSRSRQLSEDEATTLLAQAQQEAERLLAEAQASVERNRAQLESECDRLRAEVHGLEQRREAARRYLAALRASLPDDQ